MYICFLKYFPFLTFFGRFLHFNYIQFTGGLHYNTQTLIHLVDFTFVLHFASVVLHFLGFLFPEWLMLIVLSFGGSLHQSTVLVL